MKNKKAVLYLLGFLVVCIWGLIIMRVSAAVDQNEEILSISNSSGDTVKTHVPVIQPDTFMLQLNYGDPFAAIETRKEVPVVAENPGALGQVQAIRPVVTAPLVNLLNAKYLGYVWNAGARKKVAIINQNGKEQMIEEGGELDELQLLVISSDSVKVKYKGKTSFIRINK